MTEDGGVFMAVRKNIIISEDINNRLLKECDRLGVSQSNLFSFALDEYLRKVEREADDKERLDTVGGTEGGPH